MIQFIQLQKKFLKHTSGEAFKTLPLELKKGIPNYIKENVDLERLANVG